MKLKILISLAFLILMFFLIAFRTIPPVKSKRTNLLDSSNNNLVSYGEFIFEQNNCIKCHTLSQTENKEVISLDGLGGQFSNSWYYRYFKDPSSMIIDSKMPSFSHLFTTPISQQIFNSLSLEKSDSNWKIALQQADSIYSDLSRDGIIAIRNTEIIALIAYLQSIPASEELKKKRAIIDENLRIEKNIWDSLVKIPNSLLYKTINTKASIEKGKMIYEMNCFACHGKKGQGGVGPNLTDNYWLYGSSDKNIAEIIYNGVPERGMMSWRLHFTTLEIGEIVAYVKSLKGTKPENPKPPQGKRE